MCATAVHQNLAISNAEGAFGYESDLARVKSIEANSGKTCSDSLGMVMDLTGEVQGATGVYNLVHANSKALNILSFTSSLSIFTGPIAIHKGWKDIKVAQIYKDLLAEIRGWIDMMYGALQTAAGAVFAAMSTALMIFYQTTSKVANAASNFFGQFGMGITGVSLFCGFISRLLGMPNLFHCLKVIIAGDMEKIREEIKDFSQSKCWRDLLGDELIERILKGEAIQRSELIWPIVKEIINLLLYFTGAVLTVIQLFFAASFPPWTLGAVGAAIGLLFLLSDGFDFFTNLGAEKIETWEKVLMIISGLLCLGISIVAFQYAENLVEKIATAVGGLILALVHLIVITKNQKSETSS